jgi:membrane protease YdiL (CAAX protease family)
MSDAATVPAGVAASSTAPLPTAAPRWLESSASRSQILIALVVTLLISKLPEIVLRDFLKLEVPWISWALVAVTVFLWLASRVLGVLKPLERYLAIMIVVGIAIAAVGAMTTSSIWTTLVPATANEMVSLLATRVLMLGVAGVVLGAALLLGASRRELYLRVGDLAAPTTSRRKDGSYVRWSRLGPIAFIGIMLLMVWFTVPILPDQIDLAAAAPFIAIGAVAALLNAFWEEAVFRAAPLSMLQRAIGPSISVLILALWFGLGHYYGGIPSGPMGLVAASAIAVLFGRAMIETRGMGWPVALHFAGDLVIFTFLAIASVS